MDGMWLTVELVGAFLGGAVSLSVGAFFYARRKMRAMLRPQGFPRTRA